MSATTQLVNACRKVGLITSVVLLAACGGDDGDVAAPIDSTTPPGAVAPVPSTSAATPTPTGTASGAATSVTIGAAGGSLSSADGRMTVAIPAGALAAGTVIGIQPITNNAHGGVGTGYRLTPDGQAFAQPVVLSFAYADQDLAGSDPETLGAAFQTSTGYWQWMGKPVIDSTANTMKISTTHFTDIVLVKGFHLVPENKTLGINESLALRVVLCYRNAVLENDLQPLGLPCTTADVNPDNSIVDVVDWSVNGAAGVDATYGTVGGSGPNATYRAPAAKPARNLVSVSARVIRGDGQKFKVASNVTIGGDTAYAGTVSFNLNLGEGGVLVSNAVATVTWVLFEDLGPPRQRPRGRATSPAQVQRQVHGHAADDGEQHAVAPEVQQGAGRGREQARVLPGGDRWPAASRSPGATTPASAATGAYCRARWAQPGRDHGRSRMKKKQRVSTVTPARPTITASVHRSVCAVHAALPP